MNFSRLQCDALKVSLFILLLLPSLTRGQESDPMPVHSPSPECNTTFVGVFVESSTVQLQWNPVDPSAPECPDNVQYCVSYRCCRATSWYLTRCTANTSIEIQLNDSERECGVEKLAVFSVHVQRSNYRSNMTVNLENVTGLIKLATDKSWHLLLVYTVIDQLKLTELMLSLNLKLSCGQIVITRETKELIIAKVGSVIQIQAQGTCWVLGEICIVHGGSYVKCYTLFNQRNLQEINYTFTGCSNFLLCIRTTVTLPMNNTIYTVLCSHQLCGTTSLVGATSRLIVAAPPSQPERPCIYCNGTHIVLCAELPFSHLTVTALTIQVMTACNRTFQQLIMTKDLCRPIPISDIVNMTSLPSGCQLANVSVTAHSDAGVSEPSPPVTVNVLEPERFGVEDLSVVVSFDSDSMPYLSVIQEVMFQRRCFGAYMMLLELVELEVGHVKPGLQKPKMMKIGQILLSVENVNGKLILNVTTNSTLGANMFYQATLITTMGMLKVGNILFSTYDVQNAESHGGRGNISIQCVFATGSMAKGCHVVIRNSSVQINLPRSGSPLSNTAEQTVTGINPGYYEVLVFDWESDGSFSSTPSFVGHVDISEFAYSSKTGTDASQFQNHAGIGAGVGSSAAVLLLAIMVVVITTIVVKSKKTVNKEESKSDAIEMRENAAYERPQRTQLKMDLKENSAYGVSGQALTRNID